MTITEPIAVAGLTDADRERVRAWSSVLTLRVRLALERAGVPIEQVAEATQRSTKDISRRLNPPQLNMDDLDSIGDLLGDPVCLSLIRPAKDVRDAVREVLDAARELANGRAGQNSVIDAYERLTVARARG